MADNIYINDNANLLNQMVKSFQDTFNSFSTVLENQEKNKLLKLKMEEDKKQQEFNNSLLLQAAEREKSQESRQVAQDERNQDLFGLQKQAAEYEMEQKKKADELKNTDRQSYLAAKELINQSYQTPSFKNKSITEKKSLIQSEILKSNPNVSADVIELIDKELESTQKTVDMEDERSLVKTVNNIGIFFNDGVITEQERKEAKELYGIDISGIKLGKDKKLNSENFLKIANLVSAKYEKPLPKLITDLYNDKLALEKYNQEFDLKKGESAARIQNLSAETKRNNQLIEKTKNEKNISPEDKKKLEAAAEINKAIKTLSDELTDNTDPAKSDGISQQIDAYRESLRLILESVTGTKIDYKEKIEPPPGFSEKGSGLLRRHITGTGRRE